MQNSDALHLFVSHEQNLGKERGNQGILGAQFLE